MTAKKIMLLLVAMALLIAIPAMVIANGGEEEEADLEPPRDIEVTIEFVDSGTTLTVTGTASELGADADPGSVMCNGLFSLGAPGECERHATAIYDKESTHEGPDACEPSGVSTLTGPQMFIGFWVLNTGTGVWELGPVVKGPGADYTPLDEIGSVSIRDLRTQQTGAMFPGAGPFAVIHCGEVDD